MITKIRLKLAKKLLPDTYYIASKPPKGVKRARRSKEMDQEYERSKTQVGVVI